MLFRSIIAVPLQLRRRWLRSVPTRRELDAARLSIGLPLSQLPIARVRQAPSPQCAPLPHIASAHVQRVAAAPEGLPSSCFSKKHNRVTPTPFPVRLPPPA